MTHQSARLIASGVTNQALGTTSLQARNAALSQRDKGQVSMTSRVAVAVAGVVAVAASLAAAAWAGGPHFSVWAPAQKIDEIAGNSVELNTVALDGCPMESPDGLSLYIASNRQGGLGGIDIWVARRASRAAPWGAPVNPGAPINSAANDFCPTPITGGGLFFVSTRAGFCGSVANADIYFARRNPAVGWSAPKHLACAPGGPNSTLDEMAPSYAQARLYFSQSSASVAGDLYVSRKRGNMSFGPARPISELNDAAANDIQPNVRKDGREIVFSSNRSGTLGGQDLWISTRRSVAHSWSAPVNLDSAVNTAAAETRPSFSRDAQTLYFGRAPGPEGSTDIFLSVRKKNTNN